eukprot:g8742.t1
MECDELHEEEGVGELAVDDFESYDRRRSATSATPRNHSRPSTTTPVSRGRCHSSVEAHGVHPHGVDVSALSVEVAVAKVQQQQQEWRRRQQQQQQPTELGLEAKKKGSHLRSRSMMSRVLTPMRGSSGVGSSVRRSRMLSMDEGFRTNSTTALWTERASSIEAQQEEKQREQQLLVDDEAEEEEEEQEHQHVVRRHHPQQSVPSVIDLFKLQPATLADGACSPRPARADDVSPLSNSGNLAGSLNASRPRYQEETIDDVRREGGASSEILAGRWCFEAEGQPRRTTSPPPLPESYTYYPPLNSPPTAYRDGSAGTAAPTPPLPNASADHTVGGGNANAVSAVNTCCRLKADNNVASAGGGGAFSPRGPHQHHQRQWQGGQHLGSDTSTSTAPAALPSLAVYTRETLCNAGVRFESKSGGGTPIAGLQEEDLARHMREASTNTVDAGRSDGRPAAAAAADQGGSEGREGRIGGVDVFDALENGSAPPPPPIRSSTGCETAKTMSRSGTPTSNCGTPGSRGGGGGAMRRPSARLQNEAKHVSAQKRGVTTSYKNEELYTHFRKISFFLVVMGVVIGLGSHGIDEGIEVFLHIGEEIVEKGGALLGGGSGARFLFFWLYDIVLTGLAAMLTAYFSPGVEGSGIPAMKYMMDTDDLANKLRQFTLVAVVVKACGLILAAGGGLNIGREGPYTHLGGMVSYQLIRRVPFFHDILKKETVLRQVLAATVAVGLSSTFAATIGGVLFSIEITTLYYDVGNYFKAFVAAISGTVAVSLLRTLLEGSPEYIERDFSKDEFRVWQYPVFAAMGVLCGFIGPLYVNFRLNMLKLGRKWGKHSIRTAPARRWEYVWAATSVACLAATMTAVLSFFPGRFTRLTPLTTFKELLREGDLSDTWISGFTDSIFIALALSIVTWIITAALGTAVTVPSGDFIQTTVIGALVGRLIGESLTVNLSESHGVVPSTFALVGAAAMSCGATQTISAAVVLMEMTGSFELDKPVLLAAVVACGFSRQFGLNIYDSVMQLNGLESLYGLDMRRSEEMTAKDIMETDLKVVPCQTTIGALLRLLRGDEGGLRRFESYPVVTGLDGMAFVGTVSRKDLVHIVLTGGSHRCTDPEYFDFVVENLPKKDISSSWDRLGEGLHTEDKNQLFARLPDHVKQAVEGGAPGAANTVRALKLLGDKIGNMASDLSFLRGGGSTLGRGGGRSSGRGSGSVAWRTGSLDPRDRDRKGADTRVSLNMLYKANWDPEVVEDPFRGRPVDLTAIAQSPEGAVQIDRSVWKAHENMPLKNVYLLFANLRCIRLFIISGDRLTGIISRPILFKAMSNREGVMNVGDSSGKSLSERERARMRSFTVSAKKQKKRWVDVFLGERSRRGPRHGFQF